LLLTRAPPGVDNTAVDEAFSELLSLMYAVPGIVAAVSGPVRQCTASGAVRAALGAGGDGAALTHALHFRFSSRCEVWARLYRTFVFLARALARLIGFACAE
jgi:hypothetical protein